MTRTIKQWIFLVALPIYLFLESFFLQNFFYVYFNGILSEIIFLIINFIPCIAILIYIHVYDEPVKEYVFHLHNPLIQLIYGIGLYVFIGILFRSTASSLSLISESVNHLITNFNTINLFVLLDLFYNVFIEEFIWRGFVLTFLSKKLNIFLGIIITSILFGLVHYPVFFSYTHVINSCIISVIYCYLRIHSPEKFGVFSLAITHFLWDVALH